MKRNKFTCAARGCEGCSVCDSSLKEVSHQRKVIHKLRAQILEKELRTQKLEELLNNIINVHSGHFDRNQRDWPESLYKAVKEADDYLNG